MADKKKSKAKPAKKAQKTKKAVKAEKPKKAEPKKKVEKEEEEVIEQIVHEYIPKHEPLQPEDVEAVLTKYGIGLHHLPKILSADPAIKSMDLTRGDVVKITRNSKTAGEAVYYRVVI